jgi:hypothetical protein
VPWNKKQAGFRIQYWIMTLSLSPPFNFFLAQEYLLSSSYICVAWRGVQRTLMERGSQAE